MREIAVHGLQLLPEMPRMRTGTSATEEGCPMDFILTVIFYYAEPNRAPKVHRKQRNSFVECDRARLDAVSKPPSGVRSVSANCVSGHLFEQLGGPIASPTA